MKLRNPFDRFGVQRSLCGFCRRPPACVGVVVIVKGTEGCAVSSRCDVNSDKKCDVSWFSLELGVPFFLNVILFFYFFSGVGVGGGRQSLG